MKVSYYELLGMIKDGKSPEKVVYKDKSYLWDGNNYCADHCNFMNDYFNEVDMFDKNIIILEPSEIIEEDKEIEEISEGDIQSHYFTGADEIIARKLNELIRKVKK